MRAWSSYSYQCHTCGERRGTGDASRIHNRRGRGEHPGIDNSWLDVQKETGPGFRAERLFPRHCSWLAGRVFGILMAEPVGKWAQLACQTGLIKKQLKRGNMSPFEVI